MTSSRTVPPVLALLLGALAPALQAQIRPMSGGGGDQAPVIAMVLPSPTTVYTATPQIKLDWCDDHTLLAETRTIWINGTDVTDEFNYVNAPLYGCGAHKTSTSSSVLLQAGSNEVYFFICDDADHCTDRTEYIVYATPPVLTLVVLAANGANGRAVVASRWPMIRAFYRDSVFSIDSASIILRVDGVDVTQLTRRNLRVLEWEVDAAHEWSPGDSMDVYVKVCNNYAACSEVTRRTVLDNSGAPLVSFTGMPLAALGREFATPLAPGVAASGAEVETGFSVPSYVSMGVARSTGLVYSTRTSHPRALVNADIELTWPGGNPDQIKAVLLDGAARMDSVIVNSPACSASTGRRCRVVLQGDFAASDAFVTPARKWLKVEVTVTSGGQSRSSTDSVEAVLVDRRSSPYGNGWWVGGVLRRVAAGDDQILVTPNGQADIYRGYDGSYLAPPGVYTTLVNIGGGRYELRFRDGSKVVFNGSGWTSSVVGANGETTTIGYSGADSATGLVASLTDPTNHAFTFAYSSGKLTGITDPGSRTTSVTINGSNYLTKDSLGSATPTALVASYSYTSSGSNSAIVLASRADALGQTTTIGYGNRYRPTQATLPAVLPETGSTPQSPVVGYAPQETRALGALISADSVYVAVTDPLGHWTKSALNRWGAPTLVWDALGTLSRVSYTWEGLVAWSEGKVADSTRVYSDYDSWDRLVRSYRLRAANDVVRLDSLVYDSDHNVIRRLDARGKTTFFGYDAYHNPVWTISPNGDTTRTWYGASGRVDSTRAPGQSASTRFHYDATWGNVDTVSTVSGAKATNTFDSLGRTIEARACAPIEVQVTDAEPDPITTVYYQWRRTLTGYSVVNQVDSVRAERETQFPRVQHKNACGGPTWPSGGDSTAFEQVRWVRTRLGLDSLRYDTRGNATRAAYDALGRLRVRWAHVSPAELDSFRYDLAGNLRYQWTRRGTRISHVYDSRNRATADTVPGVGTYNRTFGGANDELTRLSIAGYFDSIGGVNPNVSWVYSQAGLLLTDTAQVSRVNRYEYDRWGRDSVITDVVGGWAVRYDTLRGLVERIVTPLGDTLSYSFNSRYQVSGPVVHGPSGNAPFARAQSYAGSGRMYGLANQVNPASYVPGWLAADTLAQVTVLASWWQEQRTSGGQAVITADTLVHDGARLTQATYAVAGGGSSTDAFTFDVAGNLTVTGESRTYEATTNRMTARAGGSYSYDAAGNLVSWTPSGGSTWTYVYDALDRLIEVRYGGTLIARYGYDALGRRIVRKVYAAGPYGASVETVRMIYRGGQVIAETSGPTNDTLTLSYTWGLGTDDLVAIHRHSDGRHVYVVQDALHSVRGLVKGDANGTWQSSRRYRAYGAVLDSAGIDSIPVRYRWIGREYDPETALYFVRARYYDPASQRFTQEDPSGGDNLYAYANGDPTAGRDVNGLMADYRAYQPNPFDAWVFECVGTVNRCAEPAPLFGGSGSDAWYDMGAAYFTELERQTGSVAFNSGLERDTYFNAKRVAEAALDAELLALFSRAENGRTPILISFYPRTIEEATYMANHKCLACGLYTAKGEAAPYHIIILAVASPITREEALVHELGHVAYATGTKSLNPWVVGSDSKTEYWAMYYENRYRRDLGCSVRNSYVGIIPECRGR